MRSNQFDNKIDPKIYKDLPQDLFLEWPPASLAIRSVRITEHASVCNLNDLQTDLQTDLQADLPKTSPQKWRQVGVIPEIISSFWSGFWSSFWSGFWRH
jgi:hypothetical protein